MSNITINKTKRDKKFNKEFSYFKSHPLYDELKNLYTTGSIINIKSIENQFKKKLRVKKDNTPYKSSIDNIDKIKKMTLKQNKKKQQSNNNHKLINKRELIIDDYKINKMNYNVKTHEIEFKAMIKQSPKNSLFVQTIRFYEEDGSLSKQNVFKTIKFTTYYTNHKTFTTYIKNNVNVKMMNGQEYEWIPSVFINDDKPCWNIDEYGNDVVSKRYVKITTESFEPLKKNNNLKQQVYRSSDSGICVYDAILCYFEQRSIKDRNARSILNKLNSEQGYIYKKAYTDDNINDIAKFCNASIIIKDLINGKDKKFINDYARFHIELLNTKYNHLDLLQHQYNEIEEIDSDILFDIKMNSSFYIEKDGLLITTEKTYKSKDDEFQTIFKEWKDKYELNKLFILQGSDEHKMITLYDFSMHRFINKYDVNDDLYNEIDLKKAYYNYSDIDYNKFYKGVPSGSFINCKIENNFYINDFIEQYNDNLIGFYEVKIINQKCKINHLEKLGLLKKSIHIFTSPQLYLLKDFIDVEFLNISFSISTHIPFNEKFLKKYEDESKLKYYCKAYGLLCRSPDIIDISIKPLDSDKDLYNTFENDEYDVYFTDDNLYKISYKNKERKLYQHISSFIHSYTKTLILDQILNNIDDINCIFGIKLDSIVYKKDVQIKFNKNIFSDDKGTKIENLLSCKFEGLDERDEGIIFFGYQSSYYEPYFKETGYYDLNFKKSFLQTNDIIKKRLIYINGKGGSGKTQSILSNLKPSNICYTTSCWNLIQGQRDKYKNLLGYSIPNLIGKCNKISCEKITNNNIKYIVIDEMTLIDKNSIDNIIKNYKHCFIFLLGDVEETGFYYQCSLPSIKLYLPNKDTHNITYTKSYRFDNELNDKLNLLRSHMKDNYKKNDRLDLMNKFIKQHFKSYNKKDILFNDNDIGISANNDYDKNDNLLTNYFIKKGTKPQYYIKKTNRSKNELRGQRLQYEPMHNNYEAKLFKTIHSFQGLDLNENNKIIISINSNFDYNLYYTALSRARRCDQIMLIK
jgi:hypothetical protein